MENEPKKYKRFLDMRNSEEYLSLQQYYHKKTIFDVLGVARQENPHSSFLSWLLNPFESHGMGDFPLKRFLETACFAFIKFFSDDGQVYLSEKNYSFSQYDEAKQNIVREKLLFFSEAREREDRSYIRQKLIQGNYQVMSCSVSREKVLNGQRRADIYIELMLQMARPEPVRLLLFIGQHRTIPPRAGGDRRTIQEPGGFPRNRSAGKANQATRQGLSARIRFARANTKFSLAVCFRRPRYCVFR